MAKASAKKPRRALGRGLSALISTKAVSINPEESGAESQTPDVENKPLASRQQPKNSDTVQKQSASKVEPEGIAEDGSDETRFVPIQKIVRNPAQPRKEFDDAELRELADSIKTLGVIQPILVRPKQPGSYEIVAGERRWRAARLAELSQIPVIIKELEDKESLEIALVENIQRSNLNPIEEARAYQHLLDEYSLSQQQLSERVGKNRASIANYLRLLSLAPQVLDLLETGAISVGHAKAILTVKEPAAQRNLAEKCVTERLSVREIEEIVGRVVTLPPKQPGKSKKRRSGSTAAFPEFQDQLRNHLGSKVSITREKSGRGKIEIAYHSEQELERLVDVVLGL